MRDDGSMRVTFVGINYAPEPTGIAPYTSGMAKGLRALGHDVTVVTGFPHYPWWRVADGYDGRAIEEEIDGVTVRRRRHLVPGSDATSRRALMEVDFGRRATTAPWGDPDVVVLVSPALLGARMALTRARWSRVPVLTWVQDIYTLGLVETGGSKRQQGLVRGIERSLLQRSARVVVIHDRFRDRLQTDLEVTTPIDVVRNWSHVAIPADLRREEIRRRLGWEHDETVVLHAGNMGAKQGLDNVVRASRLAAHAGMPVRFVLMGDGNQRGALEALGTNANLQFVDPLPAGDFERGLAAADILLVNELPGLTEMSVPSKLTTYFATGLPVVAAVSAGSTSALEVAAAGAGLVVPPGDPRGLLDGVMELTTDPRRAAEFGSSARAYREARLTETAAIEAFETSLRGAVRARG